MSRFTTARELFVNAGLEGVMGYYRPLSGYNLGKQSEFNERVWFTEVNACRCEVEKNVA